MGASFECSWPLPGDFSSYTGGEMIINGRFEGLVRRKSAAWRRRVKRTPPSYHRVGCDPVPGGLPHSAICAEARTCSQAEVAWLISTHQPLTDFRFLREAVSSA